jgi:hypothetical protein
MAVVINGTTGIDKVQDDSVDIADLSATGSPSSSTYLRGDNSWATVTSGATALDGLSDAKTPATSNLGLGGTALHSLTTGDNNIAIGYEAMYYNTTGYDNVAIGEGTMEANTTGHDNVAVGREALDANTTGNNNVAIGRVALGSNTTASQNVAVGQSALALNTTGVDNVGVGMSALAANTTGQHNTAIGKGSLIAVTTGSSNVAMGRATGANITTASHQTLIGVEAGYSNALGGSNTLIGYQAGRSIAGDGGAGGVNNVCIGNGAGYDTNAITGGRWNIIIGDFARGQGGNYEAETVIGYNVGGGAENRFTFGRNTNDTACSFGSTSWSAPSDERYKKDIVTSTAGLSFVNDLRPVTHKWKNEGDLPSDHNAYVEGSTNVYNNATKTYHGFVAQEVKTAIDAHSEIKDGFDLWDVDGDGRQRIADGALMPILVKAIQELSAKNTALEARITTLEG